MSAALPRSARPFQGGHRKTPRRPGIEARAGCRLAGVGSSAPETVITNDDLEKIVETNDEWIATRTGIRQRRVLAKGECICEHSIASARAALNMAGVAGSEVDMIILATSSPDDLFGSASQVRSQLTRG
jgi:3-oxoacyl-[acyl-carrier-protein] synthase III